MDHELAQLRHLYYILVNTNVPEPKELAKGLLSPVIQKLERKYAEHLFRE